MKAVVRAVLAMMAGLTLGPLLASAPAAAQDAPTENATEQPETIGPRELQNFELQGTVTREAQPQETASPPTRNPAQPATPSATNAAPSASAAVAERQAPVRDRAPSPSAASVASTAGVAAEATPASAGSPALSVALPPVSDLPVGGGAPLPAGDDSMPVLPWLAALLLAGGLGFLYWRNRQKTAFAGGVGHDQFVAPRAPAPQPARAPAPTPTPAPAPARDLPIGLVSTRLRPWLELGFRPLNCTIDDDKVAIEFELELFNSGNSPARAILVEASYFNAGPDQDQRIRQFYDHPVGEGGRATSLAPLKRMVIRNRLVTPRDQVQEYEVEGRKLFVPLIGFNALYRWGSGEGQTSASFMLGRKTGAEKMAPLRLDMGERQFQALGEQPLPVAVRH